MQSRSARAETLARVRALGVKVVQTERPSEVIESKEFDPRCLSSLRGHARVGYRSVEGIGSTGTRPHSLVPVTGRYGGMSGHLTPLLPPRPDPPSFSDARDDIGSYRYSRGRSAQAEKVSFNGKGDGF
jgi:hypothetical protein